MKKCICMSFLKGWEIVFSNMVLFVIKYMATEISENKKQFFKKPFFKLNNIYMTIL